jgi:hypothetical protein
VVVGVVVASGVGVGPIGQISPPLRLLATITRKSPY